MPSTSDKAVVLSEGVTMHMIGPDSFVAQLSRIPAKHAQPDASTLATLPKGGANLSYMGHAEVTLALIDVDPLWTWEPCGFEANGAPVITQEGNRLVMWARLTVLGKSIIGVGTCEARKGDPEKELIGDFLRNAAMRFGIGTKLWSKATNADPVGRDDRQEPTYSKAAHDLFALIKATKGTPLEKQLRALGPITVATIDADPKFAEQLETILKENQ